MTALVAVVHTSVVHAVASLQPAGLVQQPGTTLVLHRPATALSEDEQLLAWQVAGIAHGVLGLQQPAAEGLRTQR